MTQLIRSGLTDQIYKILEERIINLELKPGEKIDVASLAEEFGISETPIRDALKKLSENGLVKAKSRRGYYAVKLSEKDIVEIYELRKLLETYALESFIKNVDSLELQKLKKMWEKVRKKNKKDLKFSEFYPTDREFHLKIVKKCNNRRLKGIFSQIYNLVKICQHMYTNFEGALDEHIKIVEAIEKRNLNEAKKLLAQHIDRAKERVLESLGNLSKKPLT